MALGAFVSVAIACAFLATVLGDESADSAEGYANRTYSDYLSKLQTEILSGYDKHVIPLKNESQFLSVYMHTFLQHFFVDESQQTIEANGFFFMSWRDDYLSWDIATHKGINKTHLPQYRLYRPDLRLYNSVKGASARNDFEQWSNVVVLSASAFPRTRNVRGWPRYTLRFTCVFDYSDYPYDRQLVANPSVSNMLSWVGETTKEHVGNWRLVGIREEVRYWSWRQANATRPADDDAASRRVLNSALHVWLDVRRHAPYYGVLVVLPSLAASALTLASLCAAQLDHAVYILLCNFLLQALFTHDLVARLPPSIGDLPRIVKYYSFNLSSTFICLGFTLLFKWMSAQSGDVWAVAKPILWVGDKVPSLLPSPSQPIVSNETPDNDSEPSVEPPKSASDGANEWTRVVDIGRIMLFALFACLYVLHLCLYVF